MKTCLNQVLNQHLIEGRRRPKCIQAKRRRGSAGIPTKMGMRSSKGGPPCCHGLCAPSLPCPNPERGVSPPELPMPQTATSAGCTQFLRVFAHQILFMVPHIVAPIGRACKCFCNANTCTNSTTVHRVNYGYRFWLQRKHSTDSLNLNIEQIQNITVKILKANIENPDHFICLSAEILKPCKPNYRSEWCRHLIE